MKWQFSNCLGVTDEWFICNIAVQNTTTAKVSIVFVFVEFDCWCFMLRWEWERGLESLRSRCWWRKLCNLWKIWKILKNYEKYEIFHKKFLSYLFQLIPSNNNSFATRRSQSKKISSFKTSLKAKKSLVLNF